MRHRRHLFVCVERRDGGGKPACAGSEILLAVERLLIQRSDAPDVGVTGTACLGPCFDGPNAVIYPDAVWYGALVPEDAAALVDHLCDGMIFSAKRVADDP